MGRETERMMELTPEQQFEEQAKTLNREQLYNLAKRQAVEIALLKAKQDYFIKESFENLDELEKQNAQLRRDVDEARRKLSQLADMLDRQSG
jgi:DNA repair ATPase RecN